MGIRRLCDKGKVIGYITIKTNNTECLPEKNSRLPPSHHPRLNHVEEKISCC